MVSARLMFRRLAKPTPHLFPRCRAAFRRCAPFMRERVGAAGESMREICSPTTAESQAARLLLARKQ
jgi:hypothetical protein